MSAPPPYNPQYNCYPPQPQPNYGQPQPGYAYGGQYPGYPQQQPQVVNGGIDMIFAWWKGTGHLVTTIVVFGHCWLFAAGVA
uniref:Uncharacterized protein n=1 Tax=Meloidogyne floridensis TaxID=298350 RepID=A0A915PAG7_9BILA